MTCLRDEIKKPADVAAETYGRHNNSGHSEIDKLTQEFLARGNKITELPITANSGIIKRFTIDMTRDVT